MLHRPVGRGPRRDGLLRGDPHWKFVGEIKKSGSSSGKAHNAVPTCRSVCPGPHRAGARRVRGRALGVWGGGLAFRGPFCQLFGGCGSPSGGEVNCKQKQHSFHAPLWCSNTCSCLYANGGRCGAIAVEVFAVMGGFACQGIICYANLLKYRFST